MMSFSGTMYGETITGFTAAIIPARIYVRKVGPRRESPPRHTLDAGNLALFYSNGKSSGQGDVYYTRYLRRVKGGKGGLVIPTREESLIVRLERERIAILKALSRGVSEARRVMMPTGYSGFS